MYVQVDKKNENKSIAVASSITQKKSYGKPKLGFDEILRSRIIQKNRYIANKHKVKFNNEKTIQRAHIVERTIMALPHQEIVGYNSATETWWQCGVRNPPGLKGQIGSASGKTTGTKGISSGLASNEVEVKKTEISGRMDKNIAASVMQGILGSGETPMLDGYRLILKANRTTNTIINNDQLVSSMPETGLRMPYNMIRQNCQNFAEYLWNRTGFQPNAAPVCLAPLDHTGYELQQIAEENANVNAIR